MIKRLLALLIDSIGIVILILVYKLFLLSDSNSFGLEVLLVLSYLVLVFSYLFFKDLLYTNQSIGKRIMKIEILMIKDDSIPKKDVIIKRNLTWVLSTVEIPVLLLKGRRVGEMITGTYVTDIKDE